MKYLRVYESFEKDDNKILDIVDIFLDIDRDEFDVDIFISKKGTRVSYWKNINKDGKVEWFHDPEGEILIMIEPAVDFNFDSIDDEYWISEDMIESIERVGNLLKMEYKIYTADDSYKISPLDASKLNGHYLKCNESLFIEYGVIDKQK